MRTEQAKKDRIQAEAKTVAENKRIALETKVEQKRLLAQSIGFAKVKKTIMMAKQAGTKLSKAVAKVKQTRLRAEQEKKNRIKEGKAAFAKAKTKIVAEKKRITEDAKVKQKRLKDEFEAEAEKERFRAMCAEKSRLAKKKVDEAKQKRIKGKTVAKAKSKKRKNCRR